MCVCTCVSGCGKSVKRNVDLFFFSCSGIKSVRGELTRVVQICLSVRQRCLSCPSKSCPETTSCHHSVVLREQLSDELWCSRELNNHKWQLHLSVQWQVSSESLTWRLHGEEMQSKDLVESVMECGRKINLVLTLYNMHGLFSMQRQELHFLFHCDKYCWLKTLGESYFQNDFSTKSLSAFHV